MIFGPRQVAARINQDQVISPQITLWNQQGSEVIQGTLLVIPIEESLIYIRPLYLKAAGGQIPELKRVIVAYQNNIVMEETLTRRSSASSRAAAPRPRTAARGDVGAGARRRARAAGGHDVAVARGAGASPLRSARSRRSATGTGRSTARRSRSSERCWSECARTRRAERIAYAGRFRPTKIS